MRRLVQRSFETKEGEKRTVTELRVDEIGPVLRYATFRREFTKTDASFEENPSVDAA